MSNFFIYALLPIVLVYANRDRFEAVRCPSGWSLVLAACIIVGSFVFNHLTGIFTGNYDFGLTDYVILVVGVFAAFYSIEDTPTQIGAALLVTLRAATLATSRLYATAFAAVSTFFVTIVVAFSRWLISSEIRAGTVAGEIFVGGEAGTSTVFIGWACAGLEELVLITVLLYILISSFHLSVRSTTVWLLLGVVGSFLVNIARMVVLVWVAYGYGIDKMMWVHTHLGDALFLVWVLIFWVVFFRFVSPGEPVELDSDTADEVM